MNVFVAFYITMETVFKCHKDHIFFVFQLNSLMLLCPGGGLFGPLKSMVCMPGDPN